MIVEIVISVLTIFIGYFYYKHKWIHRFFDKRGVNYLPGLPLFGNMFGSTFSKNHFIEDLDNVYKAFPDDKYVGFIETTTPVFLVKDPELMKAITIKDFEYFTDRKQFFPENVEPLFGASLLMMRGEKWHDMRTTLSPAFTASKMRQLMPYMTEISSNIISYLQGEINNEIDMADIIRRYTNDVIASAGFGIQLNSIKDKDNDFYKSGQCLFKFNFLQRICFILSMSYPKLAQILGIKIFPPRVSSFFKNITINTMEYREKNKVERPDMLQLLLEASKGSLKDDNEANENTHKKSSKLKVTQREWSQNDLASQVLLFFIAGFDTTSSALVICIHELALNPDVQEKLYQEVKKFKEENDNLTYANLVDLKYLDCVLNESARKWAVAIFMDRICTKPYQLPPPREGAKPVELQPGDILYNLVNAVHMDPMYHPEPDKFIPERFSEENKHKIKSFTFMPFGMGPRSCIGSRFALLETKILMYYLILNFKIVKCSKTTDPIELRPHAFTVSCKRGTWVKLERR